MLIDEIEVNELEYKQPVHMLLDENARSANANKVLRNRIVLCLFHPESIE